MQKINYSLIKEKAKENKDSVLGYVLSLVKDKYDEIIRARHISRFEEDVDIQINKLKRSIEDAEDTKITYLKNANIETTAQRMEILKAIDNIDMDIEDLKNQINRLVAFQNQYLSK